MCGRYTIRELRLLEGVLGTGAVPAFEEFTERPRFNLGPRQFAPVVRINSKGERAGGLARWGLVPSWVKGKPKSEPINARCETAATSGMFRQAMERRRCLVPADGFYEWQGAKPPKQPYFIHMRNDRPFAFGGLWERWRESEDAEPLDTFTLLTTPPNGLMRPIHDRMPVILDPSDYDRWLDQGVGAAGVADLLKPYPSEEMEAYRVSTRVNNVRNEGPELIEHI